MLADRFAGWVPIRVYWEQRGAFLDWAYMGEARFTEPFFNDTIENCLRNPANLLFRRHTPIDTLAELFETRPALYPKGFIFHMSRCGSTLVAQMLASLPRTVVISEAGPIDSVLRANFRDPTLTDERRAGWLRWMLSALGQPRVGDEKKFFVKFDCWDSMELGLIGRAFPDVPWIFLCRNPIEVMVSQSNRKSAHLVPGVIEPALFGLDPAAAIKFQPEEYCAIILARICEAALAHHQPGRSLIIDYSRLPGAVSASLLDFFHVDYTDNDLERLANAARFNAKSPSLHFEEDSAEKKSQASPQLIEATERWLAPVYEKLQAASRDS
ncbi:MAG TPA: sulfotransferase family protein [Blastocatellia bacterium]|nr:sulfotransferase family protein [Blastocatellia bacterium]